MNAFGADIGVSPWLTLAFDILGNRVIDSPRVVFEPFTAADGGTFTNLAVDKSSFDVLNGAFGLKANVGGSVLINFNLLFKLNDCGLRDKVTPLVGVEYAF